MRSEVRAVMVMGAAAVDTIAITVDGVMFAAVSVSGVDISTALYCYDKPKINSNKDVHTDNHSNVKSNLIKSGETCAPSPPPHPGGGAGEQRM